MRKRTLFSAVKFAIDFHITTACIIIWALAETSFVQKKAERVIQLWKNRNHKVCPANCDHKYNAGCAFSADMN